MNRGMKLMMRTFVTELYVDDDVQSEMGQEIGSNEERMEQDNRTRREQRRQNLTKNDPDSARECACFQSTYLSLDPGSQ